MRSLLMIRNCFMGRRQLVTAFDGRIPLNSVIVHVSTEPERNLPLVQVAVPLKNASWISDEMKEKIYKKYAARINSSDQLVVESCKTYSATLNKADCFDKLRTALINLNNPNMDSKDGLSERDEINNAARLKLIEFNKRMFQQIVA